MNKIPSLISIPSQLVLLVGKHAGKIFFFGFVIFSLSGVALFYFFGYRFTQQAYTSFTHLQGVNRALLTQSLQQLENQQSKMTQTPTTNPFE